MAETAVTQSEKSTPETQEPGTFRLTVSKGHLTLEANDASVVKIIKEIGKQTGIEVDIQIGSEEKVTTGFDRVPLKDALGKIAENVTIFYTKDPNQPNFRIAKIGVYSRGQEIPDSGLKSRPKPAKRRDTQSQPERVKSRKSKSIRRSSAAKEEAPRAEPFRFTFDPSKSMGKPR